VMTTALRSPLIPPYSPPESWKFLWPYSRTNGGFIWRFGQADARMFASGPG